MAFKLFFSEFPLSKACLIVRVQNIDISLMPLRIRPRYRNNLVLGVDIGTTFTAVSFFISTNDGRDPVFHEASF